MTCRHSGGAITPAAINVVLTCAASTAAHAPAAPHAAAVPTTAAEAAVAAQLVPSVQPYSAQQYAHSTVCS